MPENFPARYQARWLFEPNGTLRDFPVLEIGAGKILALRRGPNANAVDLGDVALAPGFVNAHVHLDLPGPPIPVAGRHPTAWLAAVVAERQRQAPVLAETLAGNLAAALAFGTTMAGDIAATGASAAARATAGLPGIDFREIVGLRPARFEPLWSAALAAAENPGGGLSPHAPYSTHPSVFAAAAAHAAPKATHWLEFPDEAEFLRQGGGPWEDFLRRIGALEPGLRHAPWWDSDAAAAMVGTGGPWLLIHANHATAEDVEALRRRGVRVAGFVCCPRTRRHFGHPPYPWATLRTLGVPIALGTDSPASNPDLSVLAELQAAVAFEGLSPLEALHAATAGGAAALGRPHAGQLRAGAPADLVMLDPGRPPPNRTAAEAVLLGDTRVAGAMIAGVWVARPPCLRP